MILCKKRSTPLRASADKRLYKHKITQIYAQNNVYSLPFWAGTKKLTSTCFFSSQNKNVTHSRIHAYGSYICYTRRYFPGRHSNFNFYFEPHFHKSGGSKFHHAVCFPAIVFTRGKSTIEGKNGYANIRIVDSPREIVILP